MLILNIIYFISPWLKNVIDHDLNSRLKTFKNTRFVSFHKTLYKNINVPKENLLICNFLMYLFYFTISYVHNY